MIDLLTWATRHAVCAGSQGNETELSAVLFYPRCDGKWTIRGESGGILEPPPNLVNQGRPIMFEAAELGRTIPRAAYKARVPILRAELLDVQQELIRARLPLIIVFAGVDGAGKGETVNLLNTWMDPRWIVTRAYAQASDEERERPEYWRYWRDLPPHGRIALFLSSWYSRPVLDRVYSRSRRAEFDEQLDRIATFERTLTDDGALVLKFWMHLSKRAQKKRAFGRSPTIASRDGV